MTLEVNWLAVLVSAIASMVIGFIWYGPLFGKQYSSAMGFDQMDEVKRQEMRKGMAKMYIVQFIASLATFFVLAVFITNLGMMSAIGGLTVGFWIWAGFGLPWELGRAIWGGKMSLFWISVSHILANLLVAGLIIGYWS